MVQIEIAEADALAIARSVHDQAGDAARNEIADALEVLDLLGHVEAVEEHHRRHLAAAPGRLGMHIDGGNARALIGNFDVLQARALDVLSRLAQAVHAAHIGIEPVLALRLQEALADVVIGARALQILCAAQGAPVGDAFATAVLDGAGFACPFPEPGIVVADAVLQPQPDAIDLADFGATPRRHVQADQQAV